jgi:hypothetical protein
VWVGKRWARICTHSATSVMEEVCVAPPSEVYRKVGTQPAWIWGPVGSRLSSPGAKRWGGPTSKTRHRPRSGSLKTRPIKSCEFVGAQIAQATARGKEWAVNKKARIEAKEET